jgi:hypothetical protein
MANIIRSAKSGDDWTVTDLSTYNIRVELQDATNFFRIPLLPDPVLKHEEVLEAAEAHQATMDEGYAFLLTPSLAMFHSPNGESVVDDFAVELFRACGYVRRGRIFRTRKDIPLLVCGEINNAKTDACIVYYTGEVLSLVQGDKGHLDDSDPGPQPIAEAIAAFAANNHTRGRTLSIPPHPFEITPGITLKGTSPRLYHSNFRRFCHCCAGESVSWTGDRHPCPYSCCVTPWTSLGQRYKAIG